MIRKATEPAYARRALEVGAAGYVLKHAAPQELLQALQAAAQGGIYISHEIAAEVLAAPGQRTRWFAGFLVTLARFRALTFHPQADAFGLVRLPIKWVDAVLPLWSLGSLTVVIGVAVASPASARLEVSALGVALVLLRLGVDLVQTFLALRLHARAPSRLPSREPVAALTWMHALLEAFTYTWLRQLLVIRAYAFALARGRVWEASR